MSHKITITGLATDGYVECLAGVWADARAGTGAKIASAADIRRKDALASSYDSAVSAFRISRVFLYFDMSGLGISPMAEITGVRLKLHGYAYATAEYACAQEGTQGDILGMADFNAFAGSMFGKNAFAWHDTGQNGITFNQAGTDYITGKINQTAKLCVREYDHDYLNIDPYKLFRSGIYFTEASSEDFKPELEIEYKYPSLLSVKIEDAAGSEDGGLDIRYDRGREVTETWSDVINALSSLVSYALQQININDRDSSLTRYGISFDLSELPDGVQITGAVWKMYVDVALDEGNEDTLIAALVRSDHDPDTPDGNDYNNSLNTVLAEIGPLDHNDTGWKSAALNSEGIQAINQMFQDENKRLRFFVRDKHHDIEANVPQNTSYFPELTWWARYDSESYSPDRIMKLELTFTTPDQPSCEALGWYWYDNACHIELPDTQAACEAAGGHWWDGKCHADLPDTERECTGYLFYWYYNQCQVTNKLGVIPCVCIDTVENIWLVAGHAVKEIAEVFVTPVGGSGEPRLRTTGFERYAAYDYSGGLNGKIAVIRFTEDPPEENDSVWCNVKAMMDSQGDLIENPIEILRHFIEKYVGMIEDVNYDKTLFDMAVNTLIGRGYKGAGAILDHPPVREIIEKMTRSINAKSWFNHNDRLCIRLYT